MRSPSRVLYPSCTASPFGFVAIKDHNTVPEVGILPPYANRTFAVVPGWPASLPTETVVPVKLIGGLGSLVEQLDSGPAIVFPGGAVVGAGAVVVVTDV